MKHLQLIMGAFALMLTTALHAAVGDTFNIDNLTYTVLTEDSETSAYTVSVKAADKSLSGVVNIPEYVSFNQKTYTVTETASNAFASCSQITEVILPTSITTLGASSFAICSLLEKINIPDGIKVIPSAAFVMCSNLTNITLPNSVKQILASAFYNCSNIDFDMPENIELIAMSAFYGSGITSATIPAGCSFQPNSFANSSLNNVNFVGNWTEIPDYFMQGCSNLEHIDIPNTVKTIGNYAFQNCKKLDLELWTGLEIIKSYAFSNAGIDTLFFPPSINYVGSYAFQGNPLKFVKINDNPEIGYLVFDNVASQESPCYLDITDNPSLNFSSYDPAAFKYNGGWFTTNEYAINITYFNIDDIKYRILEKSTDGLSGKVMAEANTTDIQGDVNIEETVDYEGCTYNVTAIGSFANCTKMETITIPPSVSIIKDNAFRGCNNLISAKLNTEKLYMIKSYCFYQCYNLEQVNIPNGVRYIDDHAFSGCEKLRVIKIPNSVTHIAHYAFERTDNLTHLTFPSHMKHLALNRYEYTQGGTEYFERFPTFSFQVANGKDVQKWNEITLPADYEGEDMILIADGFVKKTSLFIMGGEIPHGLTYEAFRSTVDQGVRSDSLITIYVKRSVFDNKYPSGEWNGIVGNTQNYNYKVAYDVPVTMANNTGSPIEYKTLCRDFDVDLTHTNDNLPEGVEPLRAYLVDDVEGDLRMVFLNEIKYIPSRLKANTTDENGNRYQGVDEYVGVILRGTPGYTYYYEIGEHDYTQGAEGQWLMDDAMQYSNSYFEQNLMAGDANDDFYVYKTVKDEDDNDIVNYGLNNNKLKIYYKDGWLGYNKAYLQLPKDVSDAVERVTDEDGNANLTFIFNNADGSTDKVSSVEFNRNSESDIFYNPYGQRVNADTKGIVINNGKKYVNK